MRINAEWFLLDNMMMDFLALRLAGALRGVRLRLWPMLLMSLFGAAYAMLALTKAPVLNALPLKIALSLLMAVAVTETPRAYGKSLLCLLVAACLMGGVMFALTLLFGGAFRGGAYVCTVPVRVLLLSAGLCALLPRCIATLMHAVRTRASLVRLRICLPDRVLTLTAFVDTGNLLTDPLTGLPVVIVRPGLLPEEGGRPIPFRAVDTGGVLYVQRPKRVQIYQNGWQNVDAMVAGAREPIKAADAIIGGALITKEGWWNDADADSMAREGVPVALRQGGGAGTVHAHGGDAAGAVYAGGGADVDRTADGT